MIDVLSICNMTKDLLYYNVLLQVKLENNCDFSPDKVLSDMNNDGVQPNSQTYMIILEYYCRNGNITEANNIIKILENLEYPRTLKIYNLLAIGHAEAGDMESAEKILDSMKNNNIMPDGDTYAALMCGYAKINDINSIRRILRETEHIIYTNANFLDVAYTLITHKHSEYTNEILSRIKTSSIVPKAEILFIGKLIEIKNYKLAIDMFFKLVPILKAYKMMDLYVDSVLCRLMDNANENPHTILSICLSLVQGCDLPHFIDHVIKASFATKNIDITYNLLDYKKKKGEEVKSHFFWPLLARARQACDIKDVFSILECMVRRFKIQPCCQTVRVYVVPCIFERSDICRKKLLTYNIPATTVDAAIVADMLHRQKLVDAQNYVKKYPSSYNYEDVKDELRKAVLGSNDALNYFIMINNLYTGHCESLGKTDKEIFLNAAYNPYLEDNLTDIIAQSVDVQRVLFKIIEVCWACNTLLSQTLIDLIRNFTNGNIPCHISDILDMMLKLPTMPDCIFTFLNAMQNDIKSTMYESILIFQIYNEGNEKLMIDTLKFLELRKYEISQRTRFRAARFFCEKCNVSEARKQMEKIIEAGDFSNLHHQTALYYVHLLVSVNKFDEAKNFLQDYAKRVPSAITFPITPVIKRMSHAILNVFVQKKEMDLANEFFTYFKMLNYIHDSMVNSPVLVEHHIQQGNVKMALQSFAALCAQSEIPPLKHNLTKLIIAQKNGAALQKLINICIKVQSESLAVSELVMDLVALNQIDRALQLYNMYSTLFGDEGPKYVLTEYLQQYEPNELEALYSNAVLLPWKLRSELFDHVLRIYIRQNDWKRGLTMWNHIKDQSYVFSNEFIKNIEVLLSNNNVCPPNLSSLPKVKRKNVNANADNDSEAVFR